MGPKVVKKVFFPKVFLDLLGCSNRWLKAIFEPSWTHTSPCKPPKSLEIVNSGVDSAPLEGMRGMQVEGG